jgi:hypothetical protein
VYDSAGWVVRKEDRFLKEGAKMFKKKL